MTDLRTFSRLRPGLEAKGWKLVFVSHLLSVWHVARHLGIPCELLRPASEVDGPAWLSPEGCPELAAGRTTLSNARRFQNSLWCSLEKSCRENNVSALSQWGGFLLCSRTMAAFARANGLPILFFETGNPERKLFVDPEGVNGDAHLARHPELLDSYPVSEEEIQAWRERFIVGRLARRSAPQSRAARRVNPWFLMDRLGHSVFRVPQPERCSILGKFRAKVGLWLGPVAKSVVPSGSYVFLALQVKSDDAIYLGKHSAHDNSSSLRFAAARARKFGCTLAVKHHPAESDRNTLKRVAAFCEEGDHVLTTADSAVLVMNAREVITINSSVGLEAILLGKPVIFLGKNLYGKFSRRQAYAFVNKYLIDLSIDGIEPAPTTVVDRIIGMIEAKGGAVVSATA